MGRQAEADMDGGEQPVFEGLVVDAERRLERRDHVADHIFRRIVQKRHEPRMAVEIAVEMAGDLLDEHAVLGHREGMVALGLAVPARHAGEPMGDVLDLDVERRGIEQVEPAPRQHALPGARFRCHVSVARDLHRIMAVAIDR